MELGDKLSSAKGADAVMEAIDKAESMAGD